MCLYMRSTAGDSEDLYRVPYLKMGDDTGRQGGITIKTIGHIVLCMIGHLCKEVNLNLTSYCIKKLT